ncbi:MAG: DUF4397 domain-containing protein [Chitinophagaceae bacterium]
MTVQKMKTDIFRSGLAMVTIAMIFSGCLKSPESQAPPTAKTYISIMHLAPTAPALDVFFNDERVSTNSFDPGAVTPRYNSIDKGSFSVKFKKGGVDSLVAQVPLALYDSSKFYTLFIYNQQANGVANAVRIKDDFSDLISNSTKPYYRFFHGSPNTGAVDFYIDNVKLENGRAAADNAANELLNKFLATTSGSHSVQVKLTGTDTVVASLNLVDLLAGNAYTFYLKGLDGGTGLNELSIGVLQAAN